MKPKRPTKAELARDKYVRIMLARNAGKGVHLTAEEVFELSLDDAIYSAADAHLDPHGYMVTGDGIVSNGRNPQEKK
jgi:hypothetical protein